MHLRDSGTMIIDVSQDAQYEHLGATLEGRKVVPA